MYHPGIGRFMQTDPMGYADQMNLYGYVLDDPMNLKDPSGKILVVNGTTEFQNKVNEAIGKISSTPVGAEFINHIILSDYEIEVNQLDKTQARFDPVNGTNGVGAGTSVFVSLDPYEFAGYDDAGRSVAPLFIRLAHEFGHALLVSKGIHLKRDQEGFDKRLLGTTPTSEFGALQFE